MASSYIAGDIGASLTKAVAIVNSPYGALATQSTNHRGLSTSKYTHTKIAKQHAIIGASVASSVSIGTLAHRIIKRDFRSYKRTKANLTPSFPRTAKASNVYNMVAPRMTSSSPRTGFIPIPP